MESNYILVDSSILVAFYNPKDSQHTAAVSLIEKLEKKSVRLVLHSLVVIESLTILRMRADKDKYHICEHHMLLSGSYNLIYIPYLPFPQSTAFRIFHENKDISLIDATLLDYCRREKKELLTFDKKMQAVYDKLK